VATPSPIEQFHIEPVTHIGMIGNISIDFTNSAFFMIVVVVFVVGFLMLATGARSQVPSRVQSLAELWYEFMATTVRGSMGQEGMRFFPLIFSLFSFVLICNLFGMIPYFFTVTSQVVVTFSLAVVVILTVIIVGLTKHGTHWFNLFVPHGVPVYILPFVVLIEVISFLSRPFTLGLRLFANMLGGHIALKVFAGFVLSLSSLGALGFVGASLPLLTGVALTALEFLIAFLQAYVFAVLASVYLNDALHPGH
jgi:F-type H+-transporting ATPase subunit a